MQIKGLLFDLDGVIVDTAKYHFLAWRKMANELGIDFNEEQNEQLKGVSRKESLDLILDWGGITLPDADFMRYMELKNEWYLEYIYTMTPESMLPGVEEFLLDCKHKGYKIALGSASKNAQLILDKLNITHLFDAIIDGNVVQNSKPHPEVFLRGAEAIGLQPTQCLVFEDAIAGVEAAHNGGMKAIGIGSAEVLAGADLIIPGLNNTSIEEILNRIK
jgi:beta-phosphoglucomutase